MAMLGLNLATSKQTWAYSNTEKGLYLSFATFCINIISFISYSFIESRKKTVGLPCTPVGIQQQLVDSCMFFKAGATQQFKLFLPYLNVFFL